MTKTATVESISFRLAEGADTSAFLTAMTDFSAYLERTGGMISREVSCDQSGLWTDRYVWEDRAAAERADAGFKAAPEAAALMPFFDPATLTMHHADMVTL